MNERLAKEKQSGEIDGIGKGAMGAKPSAPRRRGRSAGIILQLSALIWLNVSGFSGTANAAQLKQITLDAFQHYVALTESRMAGEIHSHQGFLWIDQLPPQRREAVLAQLREGQVVTQHLETRENGEPIPIPWGLVHHWVAVVFVPGVNLAQTIAQQQDFDAGADLYGPDIQRCKLLDANGNDFHVYYRLHRHVLMVSATFNANFDIQFVPLDEDREYSQSYSTRIAELIGAGTPDESEKPIGHDSGYLWRLNTYTRYEERDGGVYIQTEFIALSRSVPAIFAWLVNPFIKSIPQEYLTRILGAARDDLMNPHESAVPAPINGTTQPSRLRTTPNGLPAVGVGAVINRKSY